MYSLELDLGPIEAAAEAANDLQKRFQSTSQAAGEALQDFANGPGQLAAETLSTAFASSGESIAAALSDAARSGRLEFHSMAEAVLKDLARMAAEAVLTRTALTAPGQTVNLNMALGPGANADSVLGAAGSIATAVARASALGGRFL